MNPLTWGAVAAMGAVGAPLRYLVDKAIGDRTEGVFPWGTLVINVTGSLLLGILAGLALYHDLSDTPKVILGAGFCGAFTTFSTFSYETLRLVEEGAINEAVRNTAANLFLGLAAAAAGVALAAAF